MRFRGGVCEADGGVERSELNALILLRKLAYARAPTVTLWVTPPPQIIDLQGRSSSYAIALPALAQSFYTFPAHAFNLLQMNTIFSNQAAKGWLPWPILSPFLAIFLIVIGSLPFDYWLEFMGYTDPKGEPTSTLGFCLILLFPFAGMGGAVLLWLLIVERRNLATIGISSDRAIHRFAAGAMLGIAMMGVVVGLVAAFGGYHLVSIMPAFSNIGSLGWILALFICFAIQSSIEEFIFRGWLLSTVARRSNVPAGIIATSLAFTLLHFSRGEPILNMVFTFAFSVFACVLALKSKSIVGVMGWHAGWNWFGGTAFDVPITGFDTQVPALVAALQPTGPTFLTGGLEGPEGSIFALILMLVGILVVFGKMRQLKRKVTED